jgi:hypothetical protein
MTTRDSDQLFSKLFLRRVEPGKLIDALRGHDDFAKKIVAVLKQQRPAYEHDLLNPGQRKLDGLKNTTVTYVAFPTWLARFDPGLVRPIDVNINSYRSQRSRHERDVLAELTTIRATDSGKALLQAVEDTKRELCILPFLEFSLYATALFPGSGSTP